MTEGSESAEAQFRAALGRLMSSTPLRLPPGSKVTQNNVAREAGRDPTALRKSRYPSLISEIQDIVAASERGSGGGEHVSTNARLTESEALRSRLDEVTLQRDRLASILSIAEAEILRLTKIGQDAATPTDLPNSVVQFRRPSKED